MGQRVRSRKDGKSKGTAVKNYSVKNTSSRSSEKKNGGQSNKRKKKKRRD